MKLSLINFVSQAHLGVIRKKLQEEDYVCFELDGTQIYDGESFFSSVARTLPQDPPLKGKVNWAAFADSLWSGLDQLSSDKVAIIWSHADNMLAQGLSSLISALMVFSDVSRQLITIRYGARKPVNLIIILLGTGRNFSDFEGGVISSL